MGPTRVNRKLSFESGEEQIKGYGKVTQNTEFFSTKYGNNILEVGSPEFTNGYKMMHKAWSSIVEVPYCFSRSSVKFQGHTVLKIVEFDPNWAFPDCNSRLKSPVVTKLCTKFEVAKKRCPIVFQGHTSNCKVTRLKKSSILTQIGRFRTVTPAWIHRWLRNDA